MRNDSKSQTKNLNHLDLSGDEITFRDPNQNVPKQNFIKSNYNTKVFFKSDNQKPNNPTFIDNIITNVKKTYADDCLNPTANQNINVNFNISNNFYTNMDPFQQGAPSNQTSPGEKNQNIPTFFGKIISSFSKKSTLSKSRTEKLNQSFIKRSKTKKKKAEAEAFDNEDDYLFILCINCSNLIHINDVEVHSGSCVKVKEEVFLAETSSHTYKTSEFKINKLKEHLNNMKSLEGKIINPKLAEELHYVDTCLNYINDALSIDIIHAKSVEKLKKICLSLETISQTFKGSVALLIIIERTKVLLKEKMKILKEDLKKQIETEEINRKTHGTLNSNNSKSLNRDDLLKEKEEKEKLSQQIENEKEMWKRKTINLRKSPLSIDTQKHNKDSSKAFEELNNFNLNSNQLSPIEIESESNLISPNSMNSNNQSQQEDKFFNPSMVIKKNVFIDDIHSDLDSDNLISEVSDNTSMSSRASCTSGARSSTNTNPLLNSTNSAFSTLEDAKSNNISSVSELDNYNTVNSKEELTVSINKVEPKRDLKKYYQEFVKVMLKVKFERIHSSHSGQDIPEKILFKECIAQDIPQDKWKEFIIAELKNPKKYTEFLKKNNKMNIWKQSKKKHFR